MLCEHIDKFSKPSLINDWLAHQGLNVKLSPSLHDKGNFWVCVCVAMLHLPKWNTRWMSEIRKSVESRLLETAFPSVGEPAFEHVLMQSLSVAESWWDLAGSQRTWRDWVTAWVHSLVSIPHAPSLSLGRNDVRNLYQKLSQEVMLMKLMSKI